MKTNAPVYDIDYFIAKFEAIPEELWTDCGLYEKGGKCCAFGHCGVNLTGITRDNFEAIALNNLDVLKDIPRINDGTHPNYIKPTPKQRVLAYLTDIKNGKAK